MAAVTEAASVSSPSKADSASAATAEAPVRAKNRFSLNALRLPFSSPRKKSVDLTQQPSDSPTSSISASLASSDTKGSSSTAATVVSPTTAEKAAPATVGQSEDKSGDSQQPTSSAAPPPIRSALAVPSDPTKGETARGASPHRVSFSPSTEETADAREQALSLAAVGDAPTEPKSKRSDAPSSKTKAKLAPGKWRGFKSHSTSDLTSPTRRLSLDSTMSTSSLASTSSADRIETAAALPGPAAAKRRLFRWDRKGIHHFKAGEKGKVAKVKVTKTQAVAARHAKTLEQVINAGMGLNPIQTRQSSSAEANVADTRSPAKGDKKKVAPVKPVPVVNKKQLNGLKSALLDAKKSQQHHQRASVHACAPQHAAQWTRQIVPDANVGTAGEHGKERILTANLPDTLLEGGGSKDDSEIRKRPGAAADALSALSPARPPIERKAKSAAEEALRRITLQAEATTSPQKAVVNARTSSLPPTAEEAPVPRTAVQSGVSPPAATKNASRSSGPRPLKMVCLDCGESEAHQRHAEHLEAASVIRDGAASPTSPTQTGGGLNATDIATGAGAAIVGVGALLGARSAAAPAQANAVTAKAQTPSARPPMLKSMSVANLPSLQDGPRLMGATPLQLVMDPVGALAQNSGAFDMLADVSGAAIRATQDMDSIHPPLDRMAVFVHWWGFEITLPKASMAYLGTAHSISGAFLSFLQTMAVGGGVPELLPFIKYISTFMEVEYKAIQAQDQGNGVCIAGTWFMPMALVPRPWDYPLDGPSAEKPVAGAPTTPAPIPANSGQAGGPVLMPLPALAKDIPASPKKHVLKKKKSAATSDAMTVANA